MSCRLGQVWTPRWLVCQMLDLAGYSGAGVLGRQVVDPACGNGAFLLEVVRRYVVAWQHVGGSESPSDLVRQLENCVHGVEIDPDVCMDCVSRLDSLLVELGIEPEVAWDVRCGNSLGIHEYDGRMDFVVGNPPYVRLKDLDAQTRGLLGQYSFSGFGMADSYLAFHQLGLRQLSESGVCCLVSPSSWLSTRSGQTMREHVRQTRCLSRIVDFGHFQAFPDAQTYVAVTLMDRGQNPGRDSIEWSTQTSQTPSSNWIQVPYPDAFSIPGRISLGDSGQISRLRRFSHGHPVRLRVRTGIQTGADSTFMRPRLPVAPRAKIPMVKASTGMMFEGFFPYEMGPDGPRAIPLAELLADHRTADWLHEHEGVLRQVDRQGRGSVDSWHTYGRTQGIADAWEEKVAVPYMAKPGRQVLVRHAPPNTGVFGGMYVVGTESFHPGGDVLVEIVSNLLNRPEFVEWVSSLRRYKSNGWHAFGSGDLQTYLNAMLDDE